MGNKGIYSVGKEFGKELFLFAKQSFTGTSQEGLSREVLMNLIAWHDSSTSSHVLHTWPFVGCSTSELLVSYSRTTLILVLTLDSSPISHSSLTNKPT